VLSRCWLVVLLGIRCLCRVIGFWWYDCCLFVMFECYVS